MSNKHAISILNDLIKTTLDSMKGFHEAAEDARDTRSAATFTEFAQDRSQVASQLQDEVRRLGGEPENSSSFIAAAHRGFMDLKQAISGKNDNALVSEVERGEDHIKSKFEDALEDDKLGDETRQVIERAYQSVRAGHDRASALKHSISYSQ